MSADMDNVLFAHMKVDCPICKMGTWNGYIEPDLHACVSYCPWCDPTRVDKSLLKKNRELERRYYQAIIFGDRLLRKLQDRVEEIKKERDRI